MPGQQQAAQPAAPKRITAAVSADPPFLTSKLNPGGGIRGIDELQKLVGAGLFNRDDRGLPQPELAEIVPSLENALWKVFPDGRMETTFKLRGSGRWHDGVSFTAEDVLFTARLDRDKELPDFYSSTSEYIGGVEAPNAQTVVVSWNRPYIRGDRHFSDPPYPKHLLEKPYLEERVGFTQLPYWNVGWVGTGPYKVREFAFGSHLVLEAFPDYVLGRPNIDEIVVKFIPDANTLIANILAGEVELTLGKTLSLDQALQVRDRWAEGTVAAAPYNWIALYPQFIDPNPQVILDVRFRRALLHAIDRPQLADTLLSGMTSVAHSFLNPSEPEYGAVQDGIVRYDYDPRRALQLIEGLGYGRGTDGLFRDAAGQKLTVEIRTTDSDFNQKSMLTIGDYWKQVGVGIESFLISPQLARDNSVWALFPGFQLVRNPNDVDGMRRYHGAQTPLAENRFNGGNRARYVNSELDGLLDRYTVTIPLGERNEILKQILFHMTDRAVLLGLFYDMDPTVISGRLVNVSPRSQLVKTVWNAYAWDVRN